jgi:hypothetical protein
LYNEVLAFQLIVETGNEGAKGIEISIDAPINKASSKAIGANTLRYGSAGTIEIFTEHYLQVKDSTPPNWFYGSPAAAPKQMTGWIPDALIPADATYGRGGFPVDVASGQNQGFWIDLHLPRDTTNFPAGLYSGIVKVLQQGKLLKEIPFEVTLLPYYLRDENHTNVWLFTQDAYQYFPGLTKEQVDKMFKFEAHRHRIEAVGGFEVHQSAFNKDSLERYKPYLNGSGFTPANGYHGPNEGVGEKLFPIGMYGSPVLGDSKEAVQKQADLWVGWFKKNAASSTYFWYITDEPDSTKYAWVKERSFYYQSL